LDLPDGQQIAHHSGVLRGFVYGAGDMGSSTYDLYVEKQAPLLPLPVKQGEGEGDSVVAAPLSVSMSMTATQKNVEDPGSVNTQPVAEARTAEVARAGQFHTNSLGQVLVPVPGTRGLFSMSPGE
jgi:hypothetical protein